MPEKISYHDLTLHDRKLHQKAQKKAIQPPVTGSCIAPCLTDC